MKPPAFEYLAASSVEEAVAALAEHDGEAKIIAGGQSLVPMLNFRLLAPTVFDHSFRPRGSAGFSLIACTMGLSRGSLGSGR